MRTLIYKRTHSGDPDPRSGVFGNNDCMGTVKGWQYDAVIGIGGIGPEPMRKGIGGKLTWIGIGPRKLFDNPKRPNSPRVTFDHFWYRGESGPLLEVKYPALAMRMYERNVRVLIHKPPNEKASNLVELDRDVRSILKIAKRSSSSSATRKRKSSSSSECKVRLARPDGCRQDRTKKSRQR